MILGNIVIKEKDNRIIKHKNFLSKYLFLLFGLILPCAMYLKYSKYTYFFKFTFDEKA